MQGTEADVKKAVKTNRSRERDYAAAEQQLVDLQQEAAQVVVQVSIASSDIETELVLTGRRRGAVIKRFRV